MNFHDFPWFSMVFHSFMNVHSYNWIELLVVMTLFVWKRDKHMVHCELREAANKRGQKGRAMSTLIEIWGAWGTKQPSIGTNIFVHLMIRKPCEFHKLLPKSRNPRWPMFQSTDDQWLRGVFRKHSQVVLKNYMYQSLLELFELFTFFIIPVCCSTSPLTSFSTSNVHPYLRLSHKNEKMSHDGRGTDLSIDDLHTKNCLISTVVQFVAYVLQ